MPSDFLSLWWNGEGARLNNLEDIVFLTLRQHDAIALAYSQLLSMGNVQAFSKLASLRERLTSAVSTKQSAESSKQSIQDETSGENETFGFGADDMISNHVSL